MRLLSEDCSICGLPLEFLAWLQETGVYRGAEPALLDTAARRQLMQGLESSLEASSKCRSIRTNPLLARTGLKLCARFAHGRRRVSWSAAQRCLPHGHATGFARGHAAARDAVRAELDLETAFGGVFVKQWALFEVGTKARQKVNFYCGPISGGVSTTGPARIS